MANWRSGETVGEMITWNKYTPHVVKYSFYGHSSIFDSITHPLFDVQTATRSCSGSIAGRHVHVRSTPLLCMSEEGDWGSER